MLDLPTWLLASLNDPFQLIPRIEWSPDWSTWYPLRPLSGSHSQNRNQQARWQFSGTFAKDYPVGEQGVHPYGPRARIRLGVKTVRNPVFWIPQGIYSIVSTEESESSIGISGNSFEIDVQQADFLKTRRIPDKRFWTYRQQTEQLIREAVPDARFYWSERLNYEDPIPVGFFTSGRWTLIDGADTDVSVMGALGGEAYCDASGGFRFVPVPTLADNPVWRVAKGGALVAVGRSFDRDDVYNVVAASGDLADGSKSVGPIYAWDNEPTSITYAGPNPVLRPGEGAGRFGVKPFVYTNSLINTDSQAGVAARAQLANKLGLHYGLSLTARFHPGVEAGDVIEVENYDDQVERHLLDAITYNWGAAEMSCEVRSPKEVFNPAALQRRKAMIAVSDEAEFNPLAPEDVVDVPPPPVDPGDPVPGSKTFNATDGRAFGGNGTSVHSETQMYQGYYSSTWGNNKSIIMFDYTAIAAALAGKTITGCSVKFKTQFSYYNAGLTAIVGTHNTASTTVPGAWPSGTKSNRASKTGCAAGETTTLSLGVTIGNEFKAGTAKGIIFGPGPSTSKDYYGYHYLSGIQLIFNYTTP
ncbi:minor tail protein [Streptomyces phage Microdon]|nr:minor tail protein [Streptomyces phage Microdon]